MKRFQRCSAIVAATIAILTLAAACASVAPYRFFEGVQPGPESVALFQFVNPTFISIVPYKIDGRPSTVLQPETKPMEGTYLSFTTLNTEIEFLPGTHSIEFFSVDTDPLGFFTVTLDVEAGKTYVMKGGSKDFAITCAGKPVPYGVAPVPVLSEPSETEPHATLTFVPGTGGFKTVPYILRIDGKVRGTMYRLHPRWTTMNYSGLARGIVTSINMGGMLVQPNMEAKEGYFSIRLAPGKHAVEYFADAMILGQRQFGKLVRLIEFDAAAGKDYMIEIVPDTEKSIQGIIENGIRIVEK